jgi:hypothetical protein
MPCGIHDSLISAGDLYAALHRCHLREPTVAAPGG